MITIAEIIAWVATFFRGAGMLAKNANMVKYLVSIGNLFWMTNGIMTRNLPLVVSNGFCLVVMLFDIVREKTKNMLKFKELFGISKIKSYICKAKEKVYELLQRAKVC